MASKLSIDEIETVLVDIPTIRPHKLSMTTMNVQSSLIVRIRTSDGVIGIGEAATIGGLSYGPESPEGIKLAIDTYVTPVLKTCDPENVLATMNAIDAHVRDNRFAKNAVETALWDGIGRRSDRSLSDIFGGRYRERLPIAWTLASGDTHADIKEAENMLASRRHNTFKLKIGRRSVQEDVEHVAQIKRALGSSASVRVDINQAWSETETASALISLRDAGVDLIEQPIAGWNRDGLARLSRQSVVPIMADEALCGPESAFDLAKREAANAFAVKISQSGGLVAASKVAAIAEAAGIGLYGGTMLEGAIGSIASAHLFSTFRKLDWGTELFGPLLLTEEILTTPLDYSEFSLGIPTGPGLGVEIDEDRLSFFRRDAARRVVVPVTSLAARG
ncbi:MAG: muconate/chloromuconate family cycloisomerase [Afipia sp.]|jgi:muconate cycloisomerase|uniref:Muconate cycloisomerase n=1 Tax=Candidatus Afipia apatlaquensis TaxID=2712852 RepID=A0A7C9VPP3_9BRAD|nr:muconate/chloromuconate family cycloisomerase [Afipia sp.]NGX97611.1 muconate cycloisomerase [Candidatus Afipia apatlaquensis]RTL76005.1 MAG: muconate cycloisomerase [Bradyrhizobiaceae bacterium]